MMRTRAFQIAKSARIAAPVSRFSTSSVNHADQAVAAKSKAAALIDALPGNSVVSKTGIITLTTAVGAAAISQELFVLNEEVVILASATIFLGYVSNLIAPAYTEWADGQIQKVKEILNVSRNAHVAAVQDQITTISERKDVESLTTQLFELSKQTAELEHETFVLRQKGQLAAEVKSVLDAWVRHEAQVREAEQADLVKTVLENVQKGLQDKKLQRDILLSSIAEIEGLVKSKAI
ncbi:ATP synthase F0 sector subunit 4 [Meredithblackwellia eburnea MCA 4105]